jgi:hypothetical protein
LGSDIGVGRTRSSAPGRQLIGINDIPSACSDARICSVYNTSQSRVCQSVRGRDLSVVPTSHRRQKYHKGLTIMAPPFDYGDLEFTQPAKQIKAFNMDPVPQHIVAGMQKYEDSARGRPVQAYRSFAHFVRSQALASPVLRLPQKAMIALEVPLSLTDPQTLRSQSIIASALIRRWRLKSASHISTLGAGVQYLVSVPLQEKIGEEFGAQAERFWPWTSTGMNTLSCGVTGKIPAVQLLFPRSKMNSRMNPADALNG